jgi:hypothetical protein
MRDKDDMSAYLLFFATRIVGPGIWRCVTLGNTAPLLCFDSKEHICVHLQAPAVSCGCLQIRLTTSLVHRHSKNVCLEKVEDRLLDAALMVLQQSSPKHRLGQVCWAVSGRRQSLIRIWTRICSHHAKLVRGYIHYHYQGL